MTKKQLESIMPMSLRAVITLQLSINVHCSILLLITGRQVRLRYEHEYNFHPFSHYFQREFYHKKVCHLSYIVMKSGPNPLIFRQKKSL